MSQLSHAQFPLRRHPRLLVDHRRAGSASVADSRGADAERLTGSGGRLHFGIVAGFKSESVAGLRRNSHVKRFEWQYTPKHGSWLDMAESELGVLSSQCLSRRIP